MQSPHTINVIRRSVFLLTLLAVLVVLRLDARLPVFAAEGCSTFSFKTAPGYPVGPSPRALAVGDFNNDGRQDLVVVDSTPTTNTAILLGTGGGKFSAPIHINAGPSSNYVCVADLNRDGNADLAITTFTDRLTVLLGRGDGSFGPITSFPAGITPGFALTADFNQDGKLDIAVANSSDYISVLLGNGQGGFGAATNYNVGQNIPASLAVGDFNSDGRPDLIVRLTAPLPKNIVLFFGDGTGHFGPATGITVGMQPIDMKVDDFNGDGHADLLLADSEQVATLPGDGTGNFGPPVKSPSAISVLVVADFNGDGKKDVAGFARVTNMAGVLFGNGAGGFAGQRVFQASGLPFSIVAGDFNNDDKPDLALTGFSSADVSIVLGDGAGGFAAANVYVLGRDALPSAVGLADFNHDGHTDMAVSLEDLRTNKGLIALMFGNGTGDFGPLTEISSDDNFPNALAIADFNNDGHADLAVANSTSNNVVVRLGMGDGSFGNANVVAPDVAAVFLIATDFNQDGRPDLVLVNQAQERATILLGTRTGNFASPVNFGVGSVPTAVAAGDLNGDGNPDLVVTNYDTNNISLLFGNGAGGVTSTVNLPTASHPNFVAIGDFNGDGIADLALSHENPGKVSLLSGTGAGNFAAAVEYDTDGYPRTVTARDLNGDGKVDLLVTDAAPNTISLWRGDGAGGFVTVRTFGVGGAPGSVAVGELNEDGQPDIVVANSSSGTITTLLSAPCAASESIFSFTAPNYTYDEGTLNATLTVVRTGDVLVGATVNYATIDDPAEVRCDVRGSVAYARCDYATTADTIQFLPGETSKTITIPLVNDGHYEDAEVFRVALNSPGAGVILGPPATATITITDNDIPGQPNPVFTTAFFVRQHYLDFLAREPEAGEPWSAVLNNCSNVTNNPNCDRLTVSAAFLGSPEFQLKGYYVFRFYKLAFGRLPAYAEIIPDMRAVTGPTPADVFQKKTAFATNFTHRPEFMTAYDATSNSAYVTTLLGRYQLSLITTPDPAAPDGTQKVTLTSADLVNRLNAQTMTRAQVLRAIADSDQVFNAEFNQAFVAMQYYGYLRRTPEPSGYQAWLNYLNTHPGDYRTMVNGFMNSQEYRLRFGKPGQ